MLRWFSRPSCFPGISSRTFIYSDISTSINFPTQPTPPSVSRSDYFRRRANTPKYNMASADVHPQIGLGESSSSRKLSRTQLKREKRDTKNAKKKFNIGDIKSGDQFEQAFSKAQYTQDSYSKSNYKPPTAQDGGGDDDGAVKSGDDDDDDGGGGLVEDVEEIREREAFLEEGAKQEGMHIKNGSRRLPADAAALIQAHAWIYRKAWYFGKNEGLVAKIREINAKLHLLPVEKKYVEEWKSSFADYRRPEGVRTDKDNYVNSFQMNDSLIDVIVLVAKGLVDWKEQAPQSNMRKTKAKQVLMTIYAQRSALYDMGLTYKSIVDANLANDMLVLIQEGLSTVDTRSRSRILAWLEGDDRDPTAVQQSIIRKAPAALNSFFIRLERKEPVDDQVEQLERIQEAITESNKSVNFIESDHGLGIDVIRSIVKALGKASDKDFEDRLERLKWNYVVHLDAQGWKCLVDDTPALKMTTTEQEAKLLSERPKRKLIQYRIPVDAELDERIAVPNENEINKRNEAEGETSIDDDGQDGTTGDDADSINSNEMMEPEEDDTSPEASLEGNTHQRRAARSVGDHYDGQPTPSLRTNTRARTGFSKCSLRGPINPESPTTEFGYIVGGRPVGAFSSRFIMNVGTFDNPVHRILSGTEFGRNSGPALVEKRPLPQPELPRKAVDRQASDVVSLLSVVEGESRARGRPVTYYSIIWKEEDSSPVWLSRSDLISVCGKAWLDNKTQEVADEQNRVTKNSRSGILEEAWKMDLEYLADMKSRGLHPDTQRPLRESDRKTMPWLFQRRTAGAPALDRI